jgi:PAS domain S-box-containing protein
VDHTTPGPPLDTPDAGTSGAPLPTRADGTTPAEPADAAGPENRLVAGPAPDAGGVLGELAIAAAGIGTFEWDVTSGRIAWDDHLTALLGEPGGVATGRTLDDLYRRVHPDDLPAVRRALEDAATLGDELDVDYRVLLPGGDVRWISARGRVLRDTGGRAVRVLGAAHDTTARQEGEARVGRVLEAMPTAFFSLDRDWRFTYVNAEAERVLGRTRQELLGGDVWQLFPAAVGSDFETSYRGAVATGEPVAFDAYYPPPLDAWFEVHAWPGPDGLAVYFLDVTTRRRAQEQTVQAAARAALIARVTAELTETLDGEQGVGRLAEVVVPDLADWCIVTLVDDDQPGGGRRGLRDISWAHRDPAVLPVVEEYAGQRIDALSDDALLLRAVGSGTPILMQHQAAATIRLMLRSPRAQELIDRLAPEAATVLPMRGRGGTVGVLSLFNGPGRAPLTPQEVATAVEVAGRAGLALDNSRLYRQQRQLAEGLQRALLTEPPTREGLEIAVRYVPAAEAAQVGGDWYDAFAQRDGATVLVIGDVVGHDIVAAAEMGQLRSLLRGIAVSTGAGPAQVLEEVDRAMLTLQAGTIATAVVARIEPAATGTTGGGGRALRWSNAGHPPPLVLRPDGTVAEIAGARPDLLLGVVPDTVRTHTQVVLEPGAVLLLYTDGLIERREQSLADGMARLRALVAELAGLDLGALCDEVLARLLPRLRNDDVALVAVRVAEPS